MSLSPFECFQSRFVTYLLNFPRSFVIPSKCLKNSICAASKRCSSLFLSAQASLPNFNAALAVIL